MSATAIRRSRLLPEGPGTHIQPGDAPVSTRRDGLSRHTFWPITRFTVPHCLRWQADTRYLRFEGLISRSRNIYLRFRGCPNAISGVCGDIRIGIMRFPAGSARAPTPRNADRCPNEGVVGKAIRESEVPREDIIVASKLPGRHHQYDQARVTIEESVAHGTRLHRPVSDSLATTRRRASSSRRGRRSSTRRSRASSSTSASATSCRVISTC